MKIKYYGTGAGAGIPEIFCSCRVCEQARAERGKNIRSRSQAVIDGKLGIDYPVDVFMHTIHGGLDMRQVNHVLITHAHMDHFLSDSILSRALGIDSVNFYFSEASGKGFKKASEAYQAGFDSGNRVRTSNFRADVHTLHMYEPVQIMEYNVIPLRARHAENLESMNFVIQSGGKSILWAHDTGKLHTEVLNYLQESGIRFDFVSLDCTLKRGVQITKAHMDLDWCVETMQQLRERGNADDNTVVALSHIGHLVERTHEELEKEAAEFGMIVAWDGLEVEI